MEDEKKMTPDEEEALMQRVLQRKQDKDLFEQLFHVIQFFGMPPDEPWTGKAQPTSPYITRETGPYHSARGLGMQLQAPAWVEEFKVLLDRLMIEHPELVPEGVGVEDAGEGEEA